MAHMNDISADIKKIEDLSLNAWPSHQIQVYDGWILRYSYFYTHRTNCVEQIGSCIIPPEMKIPECERIYRKWGTPSVFKISPAGNPDLDPLLEKAGYHTEHHTTVMTRDLTVPDSPLFDVTERLAVTDRVDRRWIDGLFALKGVTDPDHLRVVPQMYDAIPKDEIAVSYIYEGRIRATGLGILDRDYVGVYAIHVDPLLRRRGIASQIVSLILSEGKKQGAKRAYLQVVSDNAPAKALYRRLGFSEMYRYYFRVKSV